MFRAVDSAYFSCGLPYGHAVLEVRMNFDQHRGTLPAGTLGSDLCSVLGVKTSRMLTKVAFQIASASCGPRALSRLPWARSLASWRR